MTEFEYIPRTGPKREALRQKGQFWTPPWVAEAMASYALGDGATRVFDPAVGAGAFLQAAKKIAKERNRIIGLAGTEVDPDALGKAISNGLSAQDLSAVMTRDFVLDPPQSEYPAIIANPPYIRHHRISSATKDFLQAFSTRVLGAPLDGRTGYHVYFLLRALLVLGAKGRLCFIVPADTFEGVSASRLWEWISLHFRIDAVVTFAPKATPFPGVDTNPVIVCIGKHQPREKFHWAICKRAETPDLKEWFEGEFSPRVEDLETHVRELREAIETGLTRPTPSTLVKGSTLGDFAYSMRGIATGDNEYFLFTRERAQALRVPWAFLRRTVGRTRDIQGNEVTINDLDRLDARGRPTFLLYLDGRPIHEFPKPVRSYIREGERRGLPHRPLISTRVPWYKMEQRNPPAFLFAYLGRRNCRFIRNTAQALPLTGFLCVYPRKQLQLEELWKILNLPETLANLALVGKTYGGGALKVEPRALERLPVPAVANHGFASVEMAWAA